MRTLPTGACGGRGSWQILRGGAYAAKVQPLVMAQDNKIQDSRVRRVLARGQGACTGAGGGMAVNVLCTLPMQEAGLKLLEGGRM